MSAPRACGVCGTCHEPRCPVRVDLVCEGKPYKQLLDQDWDITYSEARAIAYEKRAIVKIYFNGEDFGFVSHEDGMFHPRLEDLGVD